MDQASGLFRRAIAQSVPGTVFSPGLAADITDAIAAAAGVAPSFEALTQTDPMRLVAAQTVGRRADEGVPRVGRGAAHRYPVLPGRRRRGAAPRAVAGAGVRRGARRRAAHRPQQGRVPAVHRDVRAGRQDHRSGRGDGARRTSRRPRTGRRVPEGVPRRGRRAACSSWCSPTGCSGCRRCTWRRRTPPQAAGRFLYELRAEAPGSGGVFGACHALDVPLVFGDPRRGSARC